MEYLYLFYDLGISGIPIILFTDPSLVHKFKIFPSVHTIGVSLQEFELYQIAMNYTRDLPLYRTMEKDTKEFYGLMNMKIECIKKAQQIKQEDTYIWIDFGILKIVKNSEVFIEKLRTLHTMKFKKMTIPGCWPLGRNFTVESIHWRFCGGFFIIPDHYINTFYEHSKTVLTDFCTQPNYKLTWETNVWTIIEICAEKNNIEWYAADHNDSIVLNIDSVLEQSH
jgi:hypothetical protein